jgi:hypothetical protein
MGRRGWYIRGNIGIPRQYMSEDWLDVLWDNEW